MKKASLLFVVLIVFTFAGCSRSVKAVDTNEYFTLKKGETVNVSTAGIKVKMLENGTSQRQSGGDSVFCKIEVTFKSNTEEKTIEVGGFASYNEWNLRMEKVNPAVDASKSSCMLIVTKTLG
jgi:Tfp pilus assembly major pilin PilA